MQYKIDTSKFINNYNLFKYFFVRDIKNRYLGNITGISWLIIQPIITLGIYWFVFGVIFTQRFENVSFIVYLVLGFWPWLAFSESVLKSISVIEENKDLLGKVLIDFKIPVLASITSVYVLNILGYIVVLISLAIFGENLNYSSLVLVIIPVFCMYLFAAGLGLVLSVMQVFIKDILQFVTTGMTLWFFLTPILYSESILPNKYKYFLKINPLYTPISFIHKAVITGESLPWLSLFVFFIGALGLIFISFKIYKKLNLFFVDYI